MRISLIAALCFVLSAPCLAQTADTDPATKDDVIQYFRTMHSFDLIQKMAEVQSQAMQKLLRDQLAKEKGGAPADFNSHWKKLMGDFVKNMPVDEMTQAMIPAYQSHFTRGDIAAMSAFYSSPVGQKVLQELPAVSQEGLNAMMPILSKYVAAWKERMQRELRGADSGSSNPPAAPSQN